MYGTQTMRVNDRFRIVYQTDRQKLPRAMVADYLGVRSRGRGDEELLFDQRPFAGTATIRAADVLEITKVPKSTPKSLPRVLR